MDKFERDWDGLQQQVLLFIVLNIYYLGTYLLDEAVILPFTSYFFANVNFQNEYESVIGNINKII